MMMDDLKKGVRVVVHVIPSTMSRGVLYDFATVQDFYILRITHISTTRDLVKIVLN